MYRIYDESQVVSNSILIYSGPHWNANCSLPIQLPLPIALLKRLVAKATPATSRTLKGVYSPASEAPPAELANWGTWVSLAAPPA